MSEIQGTSPWSLWAKTDKAGTDQFQPLICHMLDVMAATQILCRECLSAPILGRLGLSTRTIAFLSGAHDIGKACPGFQKKVYALAKEVALPFSEYDRDVPHGHVSANAVMHFLGGTPAARWLGQIVGGHHGVFPRAAETYLGQDSLGNSAWAAVRLQMLEELKLLSGTDLSEILCAPLRDPLVVPGLAGLVSVADWIGSNQEYFPCVASRGTVLGKLNSDYWDKAQRQAETALRALGWTPAPTFTDAADFGTVFPSCAMPTPVQREVAKAVQNSCSASLLIIEAPMGQGKTEAALYAADWAMCNGFARGLYVAMPTQATSNAMYQRVREDYLRGRGHGGMLNLQLVHGDALLAQSERKPGGAAPDGLVDFEVDAVEDDSSGSLDDKASLEAQSWFTAKKRPLLAPFGVGTIDQALLSVLKTKHWFVRMFGLAGKAVIFDEVHAYDAYMSAILERLLCWLAEIGCTVVLLSATLPDSRRRALVKAYSGCDDARYERYPRITVAEPRSRLPGSVGTSPTCVKVEMEGSRAVKLSFQGNALDGLSATLTEKLAHGGCAAVICNTVDRSIEMFKYLREKLEDTECLLFHARTLQMWRREREDEIRAKFGKRDPQSTNSQGLFLNPDRPSRAVVVATQVVEQSLDLDFDLMVSEIAPIDLLLQRSGRLHRHPRSRPQGLRIPEVIILCDAERRGPPPESFGKRIEYVYEPYILLRTWCVLRKRNQLEIPRDIEELIEFVYSNEDAPTSEGWGDALAAAKANSEFTRSESEKKAHTLLITKPQAPEDLLEQFNDQLADDEDPSVHARIRAATRDGDPSITVVMLPEQETLATEPGLQEVKRLMDRSIKLSHRGLFHSYLEWGEQPKEWAKNMHLRYCRLQRLRQDNTGPIGGYELLVDEALGVAITKGGGEACKSST